MIILDLGLTSFSKILCLYPNLPSSSDFVTSSAQNLYERENQVKRQLETSLGIVFTGHLLLWLRNITSGKGVQTLSQTL